MFRKSSDLRVVCRLYFGGEGKTVASADAAAGLDGWRLRIGAMGKGGVGSSADDLRRAAISSSSKTVSWVMVLTGLKGTLF
jgi:hypothetical protein